MRILFLALFLAVSLAPGRAGPLDGVQEVMGPLPNIDHRAPLEVRILETKQLEHYVRKRLTYVPEAGSLVHAWLLIPNGAHGAPAVLCLHPTTGIGKDVTVGLGGDPDMFYAHELALRGYVALAPDYLHFGEDKTNIRVDVYGRGYVSGSMKGIVNDIRAIDLLVSLPEVDPHRIGAIGHSLGGHNAMFVTAFDPRIRALVTSCGFSSKASNQHNVDGDLKNWSQDVYMPLIESRYHCSPSELPFDFSDFLKAIAPRAVFVNAPLHDEVFDVNGVNDMIAVVRPLFPDHRLVVVHPDSRHGFPKAIREEAYQFLDRELK
jgi:dienelactone hydrolase